MMNEITNRDPGLINQVTSLIEKGLTPEDIAKTLKNNDYGKYLLKVANS